MSAAEMSRGRTNAGLFDPEQEEPPEPPRAQPAAEAEKPKSAIDVFASMMSQVSGRDVHVVPHSLRGPAGAAPVGRNDPCPCGSGKKYKKCCGRGQF